MDLRTIELKIARGENLPALPQAVSAVFKVADDPTSTARDIERLIEQEPGLTAKMLRVVNSPIYGVNQVTSVGRAIAVLGVNRVRSIVLSVAFQNLLNDPQNSTRFNMVEYWRHSLAVATAAKIICKIKSPSKSEELYCMGMLHDIGLVLMAKFCPELLDSCIQRAEWECLPISEIESKVIPYTHAQLGGVLAEKWGLGQSVKVAIEGHHNAEHPVTNSAAAILFVADTLAHEAGYKNQVPSVTYILTEQMLEAVELPLEQIAIIRDVICAEVEKVEQLFKIQPSRQAMKPSQRVA